MTAVVAWAFAGAGVIAVFERLRREFPTGVAVVSALLVFGATPVVWFTLHAPSARLTASFVATAALLLAADRYAASGEHRLRRFAAILVAATLPSLVFLLTAEAATASPTRSWLDTLFSSAQGVLSWNPILYVATVGCAFSASRDRGGSLAALASLIILSFVIAWRDTTVAFAGAPFIAMAAVLAPGLGWTMNWLRARPAIGIAVLTVAALAWNYLLMVQYTVGLVPKNEPVSFARVVRQQAEVHTQSPFVYPFAFPANVWFAWREGLPVERYDLLALEPFRSTVDLALDRNAGRYLLEGWDAPGQDEGVWWIGLRRATIALPLALPNQGATQVSITARTRFEEPPYKTMEAELAVEVNGTEIGRLIAPAAAPGTVAFMVPASVASRIWRHGFNHLTFVSHGVRPADPADGRPAGPLASRKGSAAWPVAIYRIQIRGVQ